MRGAIIKRLALVIMILASLDLVYRFTLYEDDLARQSPEILQIRKSQPSADIFYFGESSNVTYAPYDTVRRSISDLIAGSFPGLSIITINKYATHAGIYREWLEQVDLPADKPRAVIVTMNLRSFDAAWIHSKLETALRQSLVLAKPYPPLLNRFLLSLGAFDDKTEAEREHDMRKIWRSEKLQFPFDFPYASVAEWDRAMANGGYLKPDGSWDIKKIELACHYIKAYAFNINGDNPRLKDFDAIARWSADNGIPVYFNLLSENVSFADSLVGRELVFLMRQNRDFLVRRYNKGNCVVVDNLERVDKSSFIDKDWTTEHYDYPGRLAIARHVSDSISRQFSNKINNTN